jgi:hypothetical protein
MNAAARIQVFCLFAALVYVIGFDMTIRRNMAERRAVDAEWSANIDAQIAAIKKRAQQIRSYYEHTAGLEI